jgi:endoribonuclease Dicer
MTYKEQQRVIHQFHAGELNVLVATSIAEEGLDIPDCNMIVRFDLYHTMIQYIQSRGRARRQDSKYFHMVEIGNQEHIQRVFDNQENEERLRSFCLTLPENRRLTGNDFDMDYFLRKEKSQRVYKTPKGARLDYKSSLVVLATFVASINYRSDTALKVDYIVRNVGSEYECEVILPEGSELPPFKSAIGRRAGSKQVAKCSAAFEACLKLKKKGYLNDYLKPTFAKRLPAMRNAQLALSSKKRAEYNMRVKPAMWSQRGIPERLFMTVLKLSSPESMDRGSRPLALLTRAPLPRVAKFPIFFGNNNTSMVECISMLCAMPVSLTEVNGFTEFTLRIFLDIFSKGYKSEPEKMPYYLAPLAAEHSYAFETHGAIHTLIDWDCVTMIQTTGDIDLKGQPMSVFKNRYVIDPHDGSRKFYTIGHHDKLRPSDPQLPNVKGRGNTRSRREAPNDIWNYSVSLWSKSRSRIEVRDDLPVIEAEYIPLRRNILDEFEKPETGESRCYIVFATLKLSAVSFTWIHLSRPVISNI